MNQHDEVWSVIRDRIEADGGPVEPYKPTQPRTITSWPKTGTAGAKATMDVDEHTAPLPPGDPIEHARRQLGVTPLPAPPGPSFVDVVAAHVQAFNAGARAAAEAAQDLAATVALPEPAPPSRRGWLRRWLENPR